MVSLAKRIARIEAVKKAIPIVTQADYDAAWKRSEARYKISSWRSRYDVEKPLESTLPPNIAQAMALLGNDPHELQQNDELIIRIWRCKEQGREYDPVEYEREQAEYLERTKKEITEFSRIALATIECHEQQEQAMHEILPMRETAMTKKVPAVYTEESLPATITVPQPPNPKFDALTKYINEQRRLRRKQKPVV